MSENELIAEFMGFELDTVWNERIARRPNANNGHMVGDMKYDTSWDWLMPVVHKIATMPLDYNIPQYNLCNASIEKPLWYIYERVIIFIKWYNQQKDQPKQAGL